MYVLSAPWKQEPERKNICLFLHMLDHRGSFRWSTGEVPSTSTCTSTGKSTEKAKHMMTHTSMCVCTTLKVCIFCTICYYTPLPILGTSEQQQEARHRSKKKLAPSRTPFCWPTQRWRRKQQQRRRQCTGRAQGKLRLWTEKNNT